MLQVLKQANFLSKNIVFHSYTECVIVMLYFFDKLRKFIFLIVIFAVTI